jgi:hypothetical protein
MNKQKLIDMLKENLVKLDLFIKTIILDETSEFCFICAYLSRFKNLKSEMNEKSMEKDIKNIKKYFKENPSKFVKVNNRNVNTFNNVGVSRRGIHD